MTRTMAALLVLIVVDDPACFVFGATRRAMLSELVTYLSTSDEVDATRTLVSPRAGTTAIKQLVTARRVFGGHDAADRLGARPDRLH
jgi:hypothetical protein